MNYDGHGSSVGRFLEVAPEKAFTMPQTLHPIQTVADWPVNAPNNTLSALLDSLELLTIMLHGAP